MGPRFPTLRSVNALPVAGGGVACTMAGVGVGLAVGGTVGAGVGVCTGAAVGVDVAPPSVPTVAEPQAAIVSRLNVPPRTTSFCFIDPLLRGHRRISVRLLCRIPISIRAPVTHGQQ